MDVFLGEIDGTLDTLDVFVSPIQTLRFGLDLLKLVDHGLTVLDPVIDDSLKLGDQSLDLLLHGKHSLLTHALSQLTLNLPLLLLKLCQLLVLLFDLTHKALRKSVLDLLLCRLLESENLSLHQVDAMEPLRYRM